MLIDVLIEIALWLITWALAALILLPLFLWRLEVARSESEPVDPWT